LRPVAVEHPALRELGELADSAPWSEFPVFKYWELEAGAEPVRKLMRDVKAVEWLPLGDAVDRLSRGYERAFLEQVGPIALAKASAPAAGGASADRAPEPVRIEAIQDVRDRRSLVQKMRDWLRRGA
jgi:8-oxo-dGTP diphosphatase